MTYSQHYNAIFHRKSVRKYDLTPLPKEILAKMQEYIGGLMPLDPGIRYELSYLGTEEVRFRSRYTGKIPRRLSAIRWRR